MSLLSVVLREPAPPPAPAVAGAGISCVNPLADRAWDQKLEAFPDATIFHTAAWARVLHQTFGFAPDAVCAGPIGMPAAILPLVSVVSGVTGRRGVSLPFTDACAPLGDRATLTRQFAALRDHALAQEWDHLELRGGREFLPNAPAAETYHRHRLLLDAGEKALFARCTPATRRAVSDAERSGLFVDHGHGPEMMEDFFHLHCRTWRRQGLPPLPYRFFEHIDRHLTDLGRGFVVLARYQGAPVAGAIVLDYNTRAVVQCVAFDDRFAHTHALQLILHDTVRWLTARGYTELDFGRTSPANASRRRFLLGWGAQEELLEYFRYDVQREAFIRGQPRHRRWPTRVCRFLPLAMLRLVVRALHRHLA